MRRRQGAIDLVEAIAEAGPAHRGQVEPPLSPAEEAGVDGRLGQRGLGVELHAVGLDAHDRPRMGREQDVWDLGEHRVGQVLDHQRHPVGLRPAEAQQGPGLGLARLEGHARPAQLAAEPDESPVVGALVHEQRLPGRDAMDVDPVRLQVIRERLLDVEEHPVEPRCSAHQAVEDRVDIGGVADGAVEVGGEPVDPSSIGDPADLERVGRNPTSGRRRGA